jgi:hypothetical protein
MEDAMRDVDEKRANMLAYADAEASIQETSALCSLKKTAAHALAKAAERG